MLQLRYAVRQIIRRPRSSALAIGTIGLALGATIGIATIVDHAVLRPLPYPEPDRLVVVWNTYPHWRDRETLNRYWDKIDLAFPEYELLRARRGVFEEIAIYRSGESVLAGTDRADVVLAGAATHGLMRVLRTRLAAGRWFSADEDRLGAPPIAVVRHEFWQTRLGGDPGVIGSSIVLDGEQVTIVGVLPHGFRFGRIEDPRPPELWTPLGRAADPTNEGDHSFASIARLRDGVSREQARAVSTATLRGERRSEVRGARLIGRADYERGAARPVLLLFAGAVGVLLLLACATVATIQLTRVVERSPELAVRLALGASRARIAGQLLAENTVLGLLGGVLGVVLAQITIGALAQLMPVGTPGIVGAQIDLRLVTFTFGLSLVTAVLFGLAPLLRSARHDPAQALRSERVTSGGRTLTFLVSAQSALAVLLLAGAALLVRTVHALDSVDPGFAMEQRLTFAVDLQDERFTPERREAWFDELSARIGALPGVMAVEGTTVLPLSGTTSSNSIWLKSAGPERGRKPEAQRRIVTAGYFAAMQIPTLRGRAFAASDNASRELVMIVSRSAADRLWGDGNRDPIGDSVELNDRWWTVVGIVDDVRDQALSEPPLTAIYVPAAQWRPRARSFIVRTALPPLQIVGTVRNILRGMDPTIPMRDVRTMEQVAAASTQPQRARAILLGGYALLATLLALTGLYGVTTYVATQRAREFAIRSALGARAWSIVRLAMRRTVGASLAGALVGLALAVGLTRVLRRFLYGVEPADPSALAAAVIGLVMFAVAAAAAPAFRSARVEPTEALRRE